MIVDYRDIMNDQAYNVCFHKKMDSFKNNAALANNRNNSNKRHI